MRVVVVGGGITGLAAAHRLTELGGARGEPTEVALLEAGDRLGGTIATERAGGFIIEAGPDSFLSERPWALDLCQRLGLMDRLVRTQDSHRQTFVVHRGRLHPLPEGFLLLAPTRVWPIVRSGLFSWPGKLRMAMDLVLPRGGGGADESLGAFVTRRLGREALERVVQPLVAGIYAADPEHLSLAATMPRFLELEQRHQSLIRGLWAQRFQRQAAAGTSGARWSLFVTLAGGMEELVEALGRRLPAGAIRLRSPVAALVRTEEGSRWRIQLTDGRALKADGVVLAAPAHQTAGILAGLDPELAQLLKGIPYISSATVTLAYRREALAHPLDGFGFIVPRSEGRQLLACTFSSVKYPGRAPEGHVLLRAFLGGALGETALQLADEALERTVREEIASLLGISAGPLLSRVHRHVAALPQYRVGHLDRLASIEARLRQYPGLVLAGNAYRGVGIANCVHSAEEAVERLLATLAPAVAARGRG